MGVSTRSCPTCQSELPGDAAYCAQCGAPTDTQILGDTLSGLRSTDRPSASYESEPDRLRQALGPNYELGRLIGRGGYAEVFAVRDLRLRRDLAIKVLRPDLIVTSNLLARFRREAEAVAALHHPHIVPVFDVGEAGGICYILMPLVQGESLKAILAREGRLPVEEARRILLEAASALAATHEAGVVHRDIKPENIVLEGRNRHVRLMDFGIAKAMDSGDRELTGTGVVVGTPQYMSPEQASGDISVDHRTDQYSLAVVGYQMVSGRVPFDGETARAIITRQLLERPPRLEQLVRDLPPAFVATLERAMEKDPRRRFDSIEQFAAALRGEVSPRAGQRPDPQVTRRRWLVAAGLLATAGATVAAMVRARPTAAPLDQPPTPSAAAADVPADTAQALASQPSPPTTPAVVVITTPVADTGIGALPAPAADSVPRPRLVAPPPLDCAAAYRNQDWPAALSRCREEADSGSVMANRALAAMYSAGLGTPVDLSQAVDRLERVARAGDGPVAFDLGRRYELGERGAPKDPTAATEMYRLAAEAGHLPAFAVLGARLEQGLGVPRSERKAAEVYEAGAKQSDVRSQAAIAAMYAEGRGVRKDEKMAFFWYETAAQGGDLGSQYQTAMLLFRGRGVARSDSTAMMWLERAASRGHPEARRELEKRRG